MYDSTNGEGRTLALSDDLWELIEKRWAARSYSDRQKQTHLSPLVFHRRGRPIGDIRKVWAKALKTAEINAGKLFHDLRRTAGRDMVRAGVHHQSVAMSSSGHKTVSMFLRYKITSGAEQREALRRTSCRRLTAYDNEERLINAAVSRRSQPPPTSPWKSQTNRICGSA